jgi:hypothetical protein
MRKKRAVHYGEQFSATLVHQVCLGAVKGDGR